MLSQDYLHVLEIGQGLLGPHRFRLAIGYIACRGRLLLVFRQGPQFYLGFVIRSVIVLSPKVHPTAVTATVKSHLGLLTLGVICVVCRCICLIVVLVVIVAIFWIVEGIHCNQVEVLKVVFMS